MATFRPAGKDSELVADEFTAGVGQDRGDGWKQTEKVNETAMAGRDAI